jgi:hypothetical protein
LGVVAHFLNEAVDEAILFATHFCRRQRGIEREPTQSFDQLGSIRTQTVNACDEIIIIDRQRMGRAQAIQAFGDLLGRKRRGAAVQKRTQKSGRAAFAWAVMLCTHGNKKNKIEQWNP